MQINPPAAAIGAARIDPPATTAGTGSSNRKSQKKTKKTRNQDLGDFLDSDIMLNVKINEEKEQG